MSGWLRKTLEIGDYRQTQILRYILEPRNHTSGASARHSVSNGKENAE